MTACDAAGDRRTPAVTVTATMPVWAGSERTQVHLALATRGGVVYPDALRPSGSTLCDRSSRYRYAVTEAFGQAPTCERCLAIANASVRLAVLANRPGPHA